MLAYKNIPVGTILYNIENRIPHFFLVVEKMGFCRAFKIVELFYDIKDGIALPKKEDGDWKHIKQTSPVIVKCPKYLDGSDSFMHYKTKMTVLQEPEKGLKVLL
jgi:hypothetical protein